MELASAHELLDVVSGSGAPEERLRALRGLRGHLDACEAEIARAMAAAGVSCPEQVLVERTGVRKRDAERIVRRAELVEALPEVGERLGSGAVTGEHVDVLARTLAALEPAERTALDVGHLLGVAEQVPVDRFTSTLAAAARRARERSDVDRLAAEVRANRLSLRQDKVTGRWILHGDYDPASGALLRTRLDHAYRGVDPGELAPTPPLARSAWKLAAGLLTLTERGCSERPVLVVDERARRRVYDWGAANAVSDDLTELLVQYAKPVVVIVRPDGSIANASEMNLGRTQRPASRRQRLVLTGLSATCMIPGCDVPADHCEIHHVIPWSEGGRTDLDNLILSCRHDHDRTHAEGWDLHLAPDRTLTITYPDGTTAISRPQAREPP